MPHRPAVAALVACLLPLSAACGPEGGPTTAPSTSAAVPPSTARPTPTSTPAAPEPERLGPSDVALLRDLVALARDPSPTGADRLPFAAEVGLGLGPEVVATRSADRLGEDDAWTLEARMFRGGTGSFNALALLQDETRDGALGRTVGEHPHCAGPPVAAPPELEAHRRLSLQPTDPDSCLDWFTVDVFLDAGGRIDAVTLDLWEP